MKRTPNCCTEHIHSEVLCLQLPKRRYFRIELLANSTCLRVSIRVLDIDGSSWEHEQQSIVQHRIMSTSQKCPQLQATWKNIAKLRFNETLERIRWYWYYGMDDFYAQCREAELYINHMAMLDLERWNEGLLLLEPA